MVSDPQTMAGLQLTDRLRLAELKGGGPHGWVYVGELLALKRPIGRCAVKLVFPKDREDPDDLLSEIRAKQPSHPALAGLQSSGVVRSGPAAGAIYLQMELADPGLQELIERGELLDLEAARELLRSLAEGLQAIHKQGLCHGHVRPTNVLRVGKTWKLSGMELSGVRGKLNDFGFDEHLFVYRAPETFERGGEQPAIDMWSLGVVVHMAMTGRLPFEEGERLSKGDMIWRILNQDPRPQALPEPLGPIVRGCLLREPSERLTPTKLLAKLEGKDLPPEATPRVTLDPLRESRTLIPPEVPQAKEPVPETPKEPPPPPRPRPPRALWQTPGFILVLMAVLATGFAIGWWRARDPIVPIPNVPPDQLYTVNFDTVNIDPKGRFPTRRPAQAVGYGEDLGEGVMLEMVQIPGGTFAMGSPDSEPQREGSESPLHQVTLRSYYASRYEITQRQWRVVAAMAPVERQIDPSPSQFKGDDLPVESVSWHDAREFCQRLTRHTGRAYRLPSEAEWEYACRAQSSTPFCFGETLSSEIANYQASHTYGQGQKGNYRLAPVAVGALGAANDFGLYDVHGNVGEWCQDFYGRYPTEHVHDPRGPELGTNRVFRGGGWQSFPWLCRSASRGAAHPDLRRADLGFRVVLPEMVIPVPE